MSGSMLRDQLNEFEVLIQTQQLSSADPIPIQLDLLLKQLQRPGMARHVAVLTLLPGCIG